MSDPGLAPVSLSEQFGKNRGNLNTDWVLDNVELLLTLSVMLFCLCYFFKGASLRKKIHRYIILTLAE